MKKDNNNTTNTIYGINSTLSVLNSDNCIIKNIFIAKNSKAYKSNDIQNIIRKKKISDKISIVDIGKINQNKKNIRSQGISIRFNFLGIKDTLDNFINNDLDNDCILILDQLEDPQNLGQIIRTCECAGVNKIILTQDRSVSLSDTSLQVSQGAFTNVFFLCL